FVYDRGSYPRAVVTAMTLGALAAELLRAGLRPTAARSAAFRVFAFALPVLLNLSYFAAVHLTLGIAWTPHLWLGSVVFSGIVGWLLSYLVLPPRVVPGATTPTAARWKHEGPSRTPDAASPGLPVSHHAAQRFNFSDLPRND